MDRARQTAAQNLAHLPPDRAARVRVLALRLQQTAALRLPDETAPSQVRLPPDRAARIRVLALRLRETAAALGPRETPPALVRLPPPDRAACIRVRALRLQQTAAALGLPDTQPALVRIPPDVASPGGSPRDSADSTERISDDEQMYEFGGGGLSDHESDTEMNTSFVDLLREAQAVQPVVGGADTEPVSGDEAEPVGDDEAVGDDDEEPETPAEIISRIAGNTLLFVPLGARMCHHIRLRGRERTELTPWFYVPCSYEYSFADVTCVDLLDRELKFTAAAKWLFKERIHEMNPADFQGARICKNGYTTVSALKRIHGFAHDLKNCDFPMEDYDVTLECIIANCPDDMLKTLEDTDNLTTADLRVMWHAGGVQYPGRRTPRSEMIELLTDQGQPELVELAYRQCVEDVARSHGAVIASEEAMVALVDGVTFAFAEANAYYVMLRRQSEENARQRVYDEAVAEIRNHPPEVQAEERRQLDERSRRATTDRVRRAHPEESRRKRLERTATARQERAEQQRRLRYDEAVAEIENHPAEVQAEERRQLDERFHRAAVRRADYAMQESPQERRERMENARQERAEQRRRLRYDEAVAEIENHPAEAQAEERRQLDERFRVAEDRRVRKRRRDR